MKHQHTATQPAKKAKSAAAKAAAEAMTGKAANGRDEFIRQAAYSYYEARGCLDGHELDDWLRAEAEFERVRDEGGPDALSDTLTH